MKNRIFLIASVILFSFSASAQNARAILDKASNAYNMAVGMNINFTLETKDIKSKQTYSYDGKAAMKGDKFKIEIPDGVTWFDGKTQWVYLKDAEEVNVSSPTSDELQGISPIGILNSYKSGFSLTYKGEEKVNGKTAQVVEMKSTRKGAEITKITVSIDKASNIFSKIVVDNSTGYQNILKVKNYKMGNIPDPTFSFNKKDYPKAEIVDLR